MIAVQDPESLEIGTDEAPGRPGRGGRAAAGRVRTDAGVRRADGHLCTDGHQVTT